MEVEELIALDRRQLGAALDLSDSRNLPSVSKPSDKLAIEMSVGKVEYVCRAQYMRAVIRKYSVHQVSAVVWQGGYQAIIGELTPVSEGLGESIVHLHGEPAYI